MLPGRPCRQHPGERTGQPSIQHASVLLEPLTGMSHDLVARDRSQHRNLTTSPAFHAIHHEHPRCLPPSHCALRGQLRRADCRAVLHGPVVASDRSFDPDARCGVATQLNPPGTRYPLCPFNPFLVSDLDRSFCHPRRVFIRSLTSMHHKTIVVSSAPAGGGLAGGGCRDPEQGI